MVKFMICFYFLTLSTFLRCDDIVSSSAEDRGHKAVILEIKGSGHAILVFNKETGSSVFIHEDEGKKTVTIANLYDKDGAINAGFVIVNGEIRPLNEEEIHELKKHTVIRGNPSVADNDDDKK